MFDKKTEWLLRAWILGAGAVMATVTVLLLRGSMERATLLKGMSLALTPLSLLLIWAARSIRK